MCFVTKANNEYDLHTEINHNCLSLIVLADGIISSPTADTTTAAALTILQIVQAGGFLAPEN